MKPSTSKALTQEVYFAFFHDVCKQYHTKTKLVHEIEIILTEMTHHLENLSAESSFECLGKLFGLDARLQIIFSFIDDEDLTEDEIMRLQSNDYKVFMKENYRFSGDDQVPTLFDLVS
ncbi:DUF7006 family protein [Vagococcus xieshaowenii]|uniref:Uncharacterized protein n=1 Tax=Vagococcus xieshaowenii TaxID=2562451 RepID=A0AAJ5EE37_9ENTE|nr:hypothetical protein [Vagococcus xieshaowenii]QCA29465.1 hypothetical protein E4Z98_09095 [Vagococcus xieshaowenii]TFZ39608.1 hypothetical protein E4031_08645 [Vagococcus xieshaowenii]